MENEVQKGYNQWAGTYDEMANKTRDLDGYALQQVLKDIPFNEVLELGCGTGKNTSWLATRATAVTAVDFSEEMLKKAVQKVTAPHVQFMQADLLQPWGFEKVYDLITANLVLEHIQHLPAVFNQALKFLKPGGYFLVSELHPARQYAGSKARFDAGTQQVFLPCHIHHLSDYWNAAQQASLTLVQVREWFDEEDKQGTPRLLSLLFQYHS